MQDFDFNPAVPQAARIYSHLLAGKDNFAADRAIGDEILKLSPDASRVAWDNRDFLKRAVVYVARQGVTQFIDIGAGMPMLPVTENLHYIALEENPDARMAYVDNDPVVVTHARALLAHPQTVATYNDLRDSGQMLSNAILRECIDLDKPVAVILGLVLHFLEDRSAYEAVQCIKRMIPTGSYLVISHATADQATDDEVKKVEAVYAKTDTPIVLRSAEYIELFFSNMELVEPGIVNVNEWRNIRAEKTRVINYGGVAVKRL
jgi:hypothetical protein